MYGRTPYDEQEVLYPLVGLRSFWHPRDDLDRYSARSVLSHPGDPGGHTFARDDQGVSIKDALYL